VAAYAAGVSSKTVNGCSRKLPKLSRPQSVDIEYSGFIGQKCFGRERCFMLAVQCSVTDLTTGVKTAVALGLPPR
jgi:hypothetical protein